MLHFVYRLLCLDLLWKIQRKCNEASATYSFAAVEAEVLDQLIFLMAGSWVLTVHNGEQNTLPDFFTFISTLVACWAVKFFLNFKC